MYAHILRRPASEGMQRAVALVRGEAVPAIAGQVVEGSSRALVEA